MGIFGFLTETGAERVAMTTILRLSFCSFCDAHLWCQVSRTSASIFPEIFFIQYFIIFSCKSYDVITYLICIIQK